ncbi:hypothetical protein QDS01_18030 [Acinetobacter nosocomialis]|uniref:hypothetical protein n=1 Tax=Acinetobacter nosocomialis TaxID=106654 RepID=UPI0024469C37|nr:hypothetical protein [Acinetobacter nosocomialis]MDH2636811.1 hypothetical protein [Acinetobacter nosocomialis]
MIYKCQECGKRFFTIRNYTAHVEGHERNKIEARFDRAKQERLEVNKERYSGTKTSLNNSDDQNQTTLNQMTLASLYQAEVNGPTEVHGTAVTQSDYCNTHTSVESPSYSSQTESYSSDSNYSSDSSCSSDSSYY